MAEDNSNTGCLVVLVLGISLILSVVVDRLTDIRKVLEQVRDRLPVQKEE